MAIRLISAGIGIVVALFVLFLNETILFPIAVAGVTGIILFELSQAVGGTKFPTALTGTILYGVVTPFLEFYNLEAYLVPAHLVCLLLVFLELLLHSKTFQVEQIAFMIMSAVLVTKSLCLVISLREIGEHGMLYVVLALCGAWIADSGAYFAGVTLGKHKLCPEISPKKTVEGFWGGVLSNMVVFGLICLVYAMICRRNGMDVQVNYLAACLLGGVCALVSVLGDLSASVIKRQKNIKDYGSIMPGHGGLMDRFDSVLFVVPTFYAFLTLFSIFR